MTKTKSAFALAITLGLTAHAPLAYASGFQLAEYSATGLGRAYAGEAAMADNASAQWRNPALLTYLKGTQLSAGAVYINPNVDIHGKVSGSIETSAHDYANDALVPNLYLSHQYSERLFVGAAFGTNYGMITDLGSDFAASHFGDQAKVETMEANLNLAYQLTEQWRFGAGIRYIMGEGHFGATSAAQTEPTLATGTTLKYMQGDDTAFGWQVGAVWQLSPSSRIGIAYKSAVDLALSGYAEGVAFGLSTTARDSGSMDITLPATAEIAGYHQVNDQWAIHTSLNWTDWSSFDQLVADLDTLGTQPVKVENWRDTYRLALGTTYQLDNPFTLRAGIAYDTSAVSNKNRTITIPETSRTWFSLGASYALSQQFSIDAGATYVYTKAADITESRGYASDDSAEAIGGQFVGHVSGNIIIFGVQANYQF